MICTVRIPSQKCFGNEPCMPDQIRSPTPPAPMNTMEVTTREFQIQEAAGEEAEPKDMDDDHRGRGDLLHPSTTTLDAEDVQATKTSTKRLRIPAKYRNKKPTDMPRRPLSAYNLFFKDQRAQIVAERAAKGDSLPSSGGLFESMAKTIAAKWKSISPEELEKYNLLAKEDSVRYRGQMEVYNRKTAEDKSLAAKGRRAERRKAKQQEKAIKKALETSGMAMGFMKDSVLPNTTLTQLPSATAANFMMRMQSMDTNDTQGTADLQMRLLASHAEGLGRAIPSTEPGPITEYLRQIMQPDTTDFARALQQSQCLSARPFQMQPVPESNIQANGPNTMPSNFQFGGPEAFAMWQLLQQQQQQQQLPRHSTTTTTAAPESEMDGLLALQQLTGGPPRQNTSSQFDPSLGLFFQLQQEQQLRDAANAFSTKQTSHHHGDDMHHSQSGWYQQGGGAPPH